jgi:acyl-CoA oxidase
MCLKTLVKFGGTPYHQRLALEAARLDFIACFCMTEMTHGSNVMNLQTTATFDPAKREFVFNTPTERDMKVWIGNLAKDATYAIVFARLITQGKDQGVHPFVIQIRDKLYHRPLPGLLIGDMGAKIGYVRAPFLKLKMIIASTRQWVP